MMNHSGTRMRIGGRSPWCGLLPSLLLALAGCQQLRLPTIDPTGERIFEPGGSTRLTDLGNCRSLESLCLIPRPAWREPAAPPRCPDQPPPKPGAVSPSPGAGARGLLRGIPGTITVTPTRMIAPVGSEVVLLGGICGDDGTFLTRQPIEWMLSQDSVGHIVDVSDRDAWCSPSRKVNADYAVTRTSSRRELVTRGTPSVTDDIVQERGQSWISLTSASEGTSYVTVVASEAATWPQRRHTATVYWVDAQWVLPGPVSVRAGQPHALTTVLSRATTAQPIAGWIVRYDVAGGAAASFAADGAPSIEVRTDADGRATAPLLQAGAAAGTTQVRIQIVRPADSDGVTPRAVLGEGYTSITWSAPGLALRVRGPEAAAVDAPLAYEVEVANTGDLPARGVVVRDVPPPNFQFLNSQPPAQIFGDRAEWQLGDLSPRSTQRIQVNVRARSGGTLRYTFQAASADGLTAETSATTQIARPSLDLKVTGPATAALGERIQFQIEVTNVSDAPLDQVLLIDRFDAGLEQTEGQASPIQQPLGRLEPGQTIRKAVGFVARQAGQLGHTVEITAPGGVFAQRQSYVTVDAAAAQPRLRITKTGPAESRVGQSVQFAIDVTNAGNVPLTNVQIADAHDSALEPRQSSPGLDPTAYASRQLVWKIAQLMPGDSVRREVLYECMAPAEAAACDATVTANEAVPQTARAGIRIAPAEGPPTGQPPSDQPQGLGELAVDISEFGDAVAVGQKTVYLITVTNQRDVSDRNVVVTIKFPEGLNFEKMSGRVNLRAVSPDGRTVHVNAVREMRPRENLLFRVEAVGARPGEQQLEVTVTSERSPQGVTAKETTTVFAQ